LNTGTIRKAISDREVIEFTYKGYLRIAEPHIYGIKKGKRQLLVYQTGGLTSSGRIPDWRLVDLGEISGLRVLTGQKFATRRDNNDNDNKVSPPPPPDDYSKDWDTIIASAD
jgi:hypothetical protein